MAGSELSPAKALLLAVQLASKSNISTLRTLVSQQPKTLRIEVVLRIILSHLPESLECSKYVPFLQELVTGNIAEDTNYPLDTTALEDLSDVAASKRVRKLHLLPLAWPEAPADAPADPLVLFLIHRSLRIDENTGLITQLPELITPFLQHSQFLRTWMISTILPLLRLNYEYHPHGTIISIPTFERLDDQAGVALLLSGTGKSEVNGGNNEDTVGRDLRGLVGPWMYGDARLRRRKLGNNSSCDAQSIVPIDEAPASNEKCAGWEVVFNWLTAQASTSWKTAVNAIEQWDGPGDLDLGGYEDGTEWLNEDDQQHLERRYARAALASAYLISEDTVEALTGIRIILGRMLVLLDHESVPTLEIAAALLSPVSGLQNILSPKNGAFLRTDLLQEQNIFTSPNETSIKFLHASLISAFLFTRARTRMTVRRAGQLALLQEEREQTYEFTRFMTAGVAFGPKSDDKYWKRIRNEILWLRSWGIEEVAEDEDADAGTDVGHGRGILGRLPKKALEVEILKALLSNNRVTLARSIYETSPDRPLSKEALQQTVISAAMNAYDNATNANKTRGGMKRCDDILKAFPNTLSDSWQADQIEHLVNVTHAVGEHRLVLKQGEPFTPVILRVHGDPISIIGKILDQNSKSYTKINQFISIGKEMVMAGLAFRNTEGHTTMIRMTEKQVEEQKSMVEKRVVSMCIDAALTEDDFETAYSYITTRLTNIAGPAHERTPEHDRKGGLFAEAPPKVIDDWSWRAALQAGKYRRTPRTVKPTHLGNTSGNLEIRHLGQRIDCLTHALRLAPKSTLQEILNVYRRCEEELESYAEKENEEEAAWDAQGDEKVMPGGFGAAAWEKGLATDFSSRAIEEAPLSLFDLSRKTVARAQTGFGNLPMLNRTQTTPMKQPAQATSSADGSRSSTPDSTAPRERKRDQLRNAAVGTLASGIGWLINAPTAAHNEEEHNEY